MSDILILISIPLVLIILIIFMIKKIINLFKNDKKNDNKKGID